MGNFRIVTVSPSKTYVAVLENREGYTFVKFTLPKDYDTHNNSSAAKWYFIVHTLFIDNFIGCVSFENFSNLAYVEEGKIVQKDEKSKLTLKNFQNLTEYFDKEKSNDEPI